MTVYIALLRAVNVGGTGKLPMRDLKRICEEAGFRGVRTYIASGNVVFEASKNSRQVKSILEQALAGHSGKSIEVLVRTADELAAVLSGNPFPQEPGNRVVAIFLNDATPKDALRTATGVRKEEMRLGLREIYVNYVDGMGASKLRIPAAKDGTARNMNTVAKLVAMAGEA